MVRVIGEASKRSSNETGASAVIHQPFVKHNSYLIAEDSYFKTIDIKRYQKISKDIKRYQKISKDIKRYQKISKDIKVSENGLDRESGESPFDLATPCLFIKGILNQHIENYAVQ
ncbi:MAG: hypothetical protein KME07_04215 [Pegethrix bostrychoides GSE-TBD4-15B]|jgi:hypothetical protein|uniref:Uncharacterized protein n=1 Tax=Pegethrix bostrychoides GSE-TBD4-15B TaxID=2839662 RepID=A0A951P8C6_9CYAN|nr:hypothetical protein [Pegethrix bostrychoides GSE-TBD4-15B]